MDDPTLTEDVTEGSLPPRLPCRLWDTFAETDPSYTKQFERPGGFRGTSINAVYRLRKMTQQFGPCGLNWGIDPPQFTYHPGPEGEVLVFCTVLVWYVENGVRAVIPGVGGDKVIGKTKNGLRTDDEALKKAYTDATSNALKHLGMDADIHLGMYDDSKYLNDLKAKYGEDAAEDPAAAKRGFSGRPLPDMTQGAPRSTAQKNLTAEFERICNEQQFLPDLAERWIAKDFGCAIDDMQPDALKTAIRRIATPAAEGGMSDARRAWLQGGKTSAV